MKIIPKLYICDLDAKRCYDIPIDERFIIKSKRYLTIHREGPSCEGCAFYCSDDNECLYLNCCSYERLDKKNVLFKLVD